MTGAAAAIVLWGLTPAVLADPLVSAHQLSTAEQERAALMLRAPDRDDFEAAHFLARVCGGWFGLGPDRLELRQECAVCGGSHGVPRFSSAPHLRVSIAHASGAVVAGVASRSIGVDIEPVRAVAPTDLTPVLSAEEAAWLRSRPDDTIRIWCRKEAAAKASEAGLAGMRDVKALTGSWTELTSAEFQLCVSTSAPVVLGRIGERLPARGRLPFCGAP
ncbi:hypothetical protein C5D07_04190 [Rathayibacter tritici]|uniref:4'-phosphopantetheinyl transferase n=2 Tax=Rathayibacter tritici TaxID=33888 RepID=A0A169C739_9MICO|nr:4'-phosphopantetheinyl transferase [Rathayibacter tritici]PPF30561.1 hypothetical protein C5C06_04795 [Rathayibacter tritici]PPI17859.1 hypothetical protein C5D07_04190 [Rathayibacter tritici]PPI47353.1 hypothetical protein C5D18_04165 [Rathayibacter tritici]